MLATRIFSSVLGILYLFFMLWYGGWFFALSVLIFAWVTMYEFYNAFRHKGDHPVQWFGFFITLIILSLIYTGYADKISVIIVLGAIVGLAMPVFLRHVNALDVAITVLGFVYPGMTVLLIYTLGNLSQPIGNCLLIFTFVATWSTDTFAYFAGLKFGKKKLCPQISPKKTIEGSIGGLTASLVLGIAVGWIFKIYYQIPIDIYHYAIMGFFTGCLAQLGDLSASVIKRYCGIKDFGYIMPGHGGLMDRFDSLLFTVPAVYAYYLLILAP